jgi:hypothetical protein
VSPRAALAEALLVTLAIPATWPLALATFLLRGGLLLVVLPIVVLPSPVSLANVLGPALTTVVLSGVPVELAVVAALSALAVVAWVVIGGFVAAVLEAEGVLLVAAHDEGEGPAVDGGRAISPSVVARAFAARAIAHVPTVIAILWGLARLVEATYRELTSPSDVVSPIALRVLRGAPEVIVTVGLAWGFGELIGGLAVRRIVLGGSTVGTALRQSALTAIRRPAVVLVGFLVPAAGLAVVLLPSAASTGTAWGVVRAAMGSSATVIGSTVAVMILVALWLVGLVLIGVTCAWRAAVWSVIEREESRRPRGTAIESTTG